MPFTHLSRLKKLFAKRTARIAAAFSACALVPLAAMAEYPERPITLIVPYAAGGGTDAVARALGMALEKELGKPVNVSNRGGGNAVVGHNAIATAAPDGYTIGMITSEISMLHWQGLTKLTYKDYTPLAVVNAEWAGLQIASDSKYKTLKDLLSAIREQPAGTFKASGTGYGASWHVALNGLLLDQGIDPAKVKWVPSQGAAPAMVELAAGGVHIVPCSIPEARSMIESGKAKSLAVMGPDRHAKFPQVPTLKEAIGTGYTDGAWRSIAAPAGLDPAVRKKLESALQAAYKSQIYQDFLSKQGFGPRWLAGDELVTFLAAHDQSMGQIMDKMGLKK